MAGHTRRHHYGWSVMRDKPGTGTISLIEWCWYISFVSMLLRVSQCSNLENRDQTAIKPRSNRDAWRVMRRGGVITRVVHGKNAGFARLAINAHLCVLSDGFAGWVALRYGRVESQRRWHEKPRWKRTKPRLLRAQNACITRKARWK